MRSFIRIDKNSRRETLFDVLFLSPQIMLYLTFTIAPFILGFFIIFTNRINYLTTDVDFIGLKNFISIFEKPLIGPFISSVKRTAVFTVINYLMVFLFGAPLALLMFEFEGKLKKGFFSVIYMPYIVSGLGIGLMLPMLFSRDNGSLNLLFTKIGLIQNAIDIKKPLVSAIALPFIVGWRSAGFNMALFLTGLLSIPTDTIDASKVDGVNYWQRLRYVYFPQMIPCIIIATIFCLIGSFGIFDVPVGMGGLAANESVRYFALHLYFSGFGTHAQQGATLAEAVTMSMVVYLPLATIAFFLNNIQKKLQY